KLGSFSDTAAAVEDWLQIDPAFQLVPEALPGGEIPRVCAGHSPNAQVVAEAAQPGDMVRQRGPSRRLVPGLKEALQERPALPGQFMRPPPPRFLRLLILQTGLRAFGPVRHCLQISGPAPRLTQQP